MKSVSVASLCDLPLGHGQAQVDRALLERVVGPTATSHILLVDGTTEISAEVVTAYAASIGGGAPNIAVLNLTAVEGNPDSAEGDAAILDFDFDFDFDLDAEPGTATNVPAHGLVLNELLRPGFAIAMETSRLRDAIPAMPSMPFAWLVSSLLRDAHLDGLHLRRYGAIVPGQVDTWSPAATTPIQIQEEASGQSLNGVTVSIAAAGTSLSFPDRHHRFTASVRRRRTQHLCFWYERRRVLDHRRRLFGDRNRTGRPGSAGFPRYARPDWRRSGNSLRTPKSEKNSLRGCRTRLFGLPACHGAI